MFAAAVDPAAVPGLTPDQVLGFVVLDLAIIFGLARLTGALFRRIGQPRVVGEIVAGVLLGPTLLGPKIFSWGNPPEVLHCAAALAPTSGTPSITTCLFPPQARSVIGVIGQVALILFMLLVGMEVDHAMLKGRLRGVMSVALTVILVPIGLGFAITPLLFNEKFAAGFGTPDEPSRLAFGLLVGGMLAVTAFPVMARILQEKGLTQTEMGSIGVAAAAVVTVLMFLTLAVGAGVARSDSAGDIVERFVGAVVYLAVMFLVVRPLLRPLGRRFEQRGVLTPELLGGMVALGFASAYVAHQIGINVIVGAFVAGIVIPEPRAAIYREVSNHLFEVTTALLLPVFLAYSGLNTDFTQLGISFVFGVTVFVLTGIVAKWAGAAVGARLAGLSWAEGNVLGILMNCRGLLVLVAALIASDTGVITAPMQVCGVLMALLTTGMTGPLIDRFVPKGDVAEEPPMTELATG